MIFYHITTPERWAMFATKDYYNAESLVTEGFIHASFAEQIAPTLAIHFKNVKKIIILTVDPSVLEAELRVEASRNGDLFPHIYGNINKTAIVAIEERVLVN